MSVVDGCLVVVHCYLCIVVCVVLLMAMLLLLLFVLFACCWPLCVDAHGDLGIVLVVCVVLSVCCVWR